MYNIKILIDYFVICLIRPQLLHLLFMDLPTQFFSPVSFIFPKNVCLIMRVLELKNKRATGLNCHLSIRDFSLTSCQKGSYLYINSPIKEEMKINKGIGEMHHNPLTQ